MKIPEWKQQKLNNSCVLNVLCMMLSAYDIEIEVKDIVKACFMDLMIDYDLHEKTFNCGFLANQTAENYNNLFSQYNLELCEKTLYDTDQFNYEAKHLCSKGVPFMLSVPNSLLPYQEGKPASQSKHALLVFRADHDKITVLDSDAGLERNRNYQFNEIQDKVIYSIELRKIRQIKTLNYAYPAPLTKNALFLPKTEVIHLSIKNILLWKSMTRESLKSLSSDYKAFYQFTSRFIRPLVNDFYTALKCTCPSHSLLTVLEGIKEQTFDFLRQGKNENNIPIKEIHCYYRIQCALLADSIRFYLEEANR